MNTLPSLPKLVIAKIEDQKHLPLITRMNADEPEEEDSWKMSFLILLFGFYLRVSAKSAANAFDLQFWQLPILAIMAIAYSAAPHSIALNRS